MPHHLIDIRDPAEGYSAGEFVAMPWRRSPPFRRAVICRCWSAARCSISARSITGWRRCRPPRRRCARRSMPRRRAPAGRRCTPSWAHRSGGGRAHRAAMMRSASNALSRCIGLTGVPISHWQRATAVAQRPVLLAALCAAARLARSSCASSWSSVCGACSRRDSSMRCAACMSAVTSRRSTPRSAPSATVSSGRSSVPACSREQAEQQALAATLQLAKRQLTWLRREPELDCCYRHRL